jgi:hypothetical protein
MPRNNAIQECCLMKYLTSCRKTLSRDKHPPDPFRIDAQNLLKDVARRATTN